MKMKRCFLYVITLASAVSLTSHVNAQSTTDSMRIDLNKAIEIALSENVTMKIANHEIEVKKNYKKEQIVTLFPDVSGSASYNRMLQKQKMSMDLPPMGNVIMEVGSYNTLNFGFSASLPVIAPALWFNLKLSQLDVEIAMVNARSSKISMIHEVKKAYFNYLLAKDSYEVLMQNYNNVELNYKNIADKFELGMASEFDMLRAEVQLKNQIPNIQSAKTTIDLATMMLKILIGVDIDAPIFFEGNLKSFEEEMLSVPVPNINNITLENNPDLNKLDYSLQQLNAGMKIIKSSASPTLGVSASWQMAAMSDNFNDLKGFPNSFVALGLNVPITSWAGTAYKIKSNKLNMKSLEYQKTYLEDNLKIAALNAINQIDNAIEELTSNKETVMQAEKAYEISKKQYDIGMGTWLDLSAAELALTSSKLTYNQSIYNYLNAHAELEKIIGNN